MPQSVRARLMVTGVVQGVYYRATARQEARTLGITGWVKNRTDGAVEAVIEGDRVNVLKFIDWCRQGPPASQVRDVQVEWGDFRGEYQDFSIVS
jgi:acylphosphatase